MSIEAEKNFKNKVDYLKRLNNIETDVIKALIKAGLIEVDQLIYEYDTNCCHVGYRAGNNRKQIMIRKRVSNKLVYYNV